MEALEPVPKARVGRDGLLKARVSKCFKRQLQARAEAEGKTSSEAVRQALLEWMARGRNES